MSMRLLQQIFYSVVLLSILSLPVSVLSQAAGNIHVVKKGETLSLIAKQSKVSLADLMQENNLNEKSLLQIGQKIKIPSGTKHTETIVQAPVAKKPVTEAPVVTTKKAEESIHVVKGKETLYSIGKHFNVSVEQLKAWNKLSSNNIHDGQKLIVSGNDTKETSQPVVKETPAKPQPEKVVVKKEEPIVKPPAEEKKTVIVKEEKKPTAKPEPAAPPVVKEDKQPIAEQPKETIVAKEIEKPALKKENIIAPPSQESISEGGYFESFYLKGEQHTSGDAATFKTSSGWSDKKYYVLMNNVDSNAVVRITVNNHTVFAKVLGSLPDIKEDNGLLLRLSNAAAASLGVSDAKFTVKVDY